MSVEYIPIVGPVAGLILLVVGSIVAVKVQLAKRPTFKEADSRYQNEKVCDTIHKSVDEKLKCLPAIKKSVTEIETKINIFLEKNGK